MSSFLIKLLFVSTILLSSAIAFESQRLKDLPLSDCQNGGEKRDGVCECALNHEGPHCENEICRNGGRPHKDRNGKIKCDCKADVEGERCEKVTRCEHGELLDGECRCEKGYTGLLCSERPCRNGSPIFIPGIGDYECECDLGYIGSFCGTKLECDNGGRVGNGNTCVCVNGFSGDHCELCPSPLVVVDGECVQEITETLASSSMGDSIMQQWHLLAVIAGVLLVLILLVVAVLFAVRSYRSKPSRVSSAQGSAIVPHPDGTDV